MEIVINIDENVFTRLFDNGTEDYAIVNNDLYAIAKAIRNGTPLPKGHWINADEKVTAQLYNDQYEEYKEEEMTIAEYLDRYTDEGCPVSIIEKDGE